MGSRREGLLPRARADLGKLSEQVRTQGLAVACTNATKVLLSRALFAPFDRGRDTVLTDATDEKVQLADLTIIGGNRRYGVEYAPTPGELFLLLMTNLPHQLDEFTFVDFGSGKGRILCLASTLGFRRVVGVEFSEELHQEAERNIAAFRRSPFCKSRDVTSLNMDASDFSIPLTKCVFFMYNPFQEKILSEVVEKITHSLEAQPRTTYIVYYNPVEADVIDRVGIFARVPLNLRSRLAYRVRDLHSVHIYEAQIGHDRPMPSR